MGLVLATVALSSCRQPEGVPSASRRLSLDGAMIAHCRLAVNTLGSIRLKTDKPPFRFRTLLLYTCTKRQTIQIGPVRSPAGFRILPMVAPIRHRVRPLRACWRHHRPALVAGRFHFCPSAHNGEPSLPWCADCPEMAQPVTLPVAGWRCPAALPRDTRYTPHPEPTLNESSQVVIGCYTGPAHLAA